MSALGSYDSPGFTDMTPAGPVNAQGYTAGGSAPPYPVPQIEGTTPASALVTPYGSGYQNADRVAVTPDASQVPAQTDLYSGSDADPLSGLAGNEAGYTGAGRGTAGHVGHPGAAAVPSLLQQVSAARRPS